MANVQYLGNGIYRATYKDFSLLGASGKPVVKNKRYYCIDKYGHKITTPPARQIKARQLEILDEITRLEANTRQNEAVLSGNSHAAWWYIVNIAMQRPCRSNNIKTAREAARELQRLSDWLQQNYPTLSLADFGKKHAKEYLATIGERLSLSSVMTINKQLASSWNIMAETLDNMTINNPWQGNTRTIRECVKNKKVVAVRAFSAKWLHGFFEWLKNIKTDKSSRMTEYRAKEYYAYFYLLATTGWRADDVRCLTWRQVNTDRRYIYTTHRKTANTTGNTTYLYLGDGMAACLHHLAHHGDDSRIFSITCDGASEILERYISICPPDDYIVECVGKIRKKSHTLNSFRHSVISHLKANGKDSDLTYYITGHSARGIEAKHYNDFQIDIQKSTGGAMMIMENIINGKTDDDIMQFIKDKGLTIEMLKSLLGG